MARLTRARALLSGAEQAPADGIASESTRTTEDETEDEDEEHGAAAVEAAEAAGDLEKGTRVAGRAGKGADSLAPKAAFRAAASGHRRCRGLRGECAFVVCAGISHESYHACGFVAVRGCPRVDVMPLMSCTGRHRLVRAPLIRARVRAPAPCRGCHR